ncbi:MAG: secretin and TonB N-terminal domain-containing protein, partial [Planctomycetaceae bacterium]|nr:secretin and TonB N-terminal domain-containing protein [Planctomycetaceae bacterium]
MKRRFGITVLRLLGITALVKTSLRGAGGPPAYSSAPGESARSSDGPQDYWPIVQARQKQNVPYPEPSSSQPIRPAFYQQPVIPTPSPQQFGPNAVPSAPPSSDQTTRIPFNEWQTPPNLNVSSTGDRVSLAVKGAPLSTVLSLIAQQHGLNIVTGDSAQQLVSISLSNVPLEEALDAILRVNGFRWTRRKNIIYVSAIKTGNALDADVQGRRLQVFQLDYVAASDIEKVVQGLLTPGGKAFILESSPTDRRRTREAIAV